MERVICWISAVRRWAFQIPLFWIACVAISAVAAADGYEAALLLPLFTGLVVIYCIQNSLARLGVILVMLIIGVGFAVWHVTTVRRIHSFPFAATLATGNSLDVKGKGWIHSDTGQKNPNRYRGVMAVDELEVNGQSVELRHTHYVVMSIEQVDARSIVYGDEITFSGQLKSIDPAAAPGAFDPAKYYFRSADSIVQLVVSAGDRFLISQDNPRGWWLRRHAIAARKWMETGLEHGVASSDYTLNQTILAMVLGSREKSPEEVEEWFRLSGTLHIFAVSGLHVGVVALLLWWLLKWTGIPRSSAVYILIPAILFYAILTGLRPSSCRAALMLSVFLLGFALRLRSSPLNALGLAALILVAFDTQQVFLPGFQLSFCVVFVLILVGSFLSQWLHQPFKVDVFIPRRRVSLWRRMVDKVVQFVGGATAISVASWIGSFFLMDTHFSGVTPIGLVANIVMVPIAGMIVTVAGISIACFGVKLTFISVVLNQVNLALITMLTGLAQLFAGIPGGHINTGEELDKQAVVSLNVMGVGGETASLLRNDDRYWLIDSGGGQTFASQMLPLIRTRGVNQIEGLILSHGDSGHISSAPYILQHMPPKLVVESQLKNRARVYKEIDHLITSQNIERLQVRSPQRLELGNELVLEVLYPSRRNPPTGIADDRCLVLLMYCQGWRVLFTFDSGFLVEKELLNRKDDLKADIWIRGEHSQTDSASYEFVDAVSPEVVITTEGDFPPAQRLNAKWKKYVKGQGIRLLSLKEVGSVQVDLEERKLQIQPFLNSDVIEIEK